MIKYIMDISDKLREAIKKSKMSKKEVAEKAHISVQTLSKYLNKGGTPALDNAKALSEVLSIPIECLIGEPHAPSSEISSEDDVLDAIGRDPRKYALAAMIADMDGDQLRKSYDYILDQKRLSELMKFEAI
ncbi:hypothetical protein FACS1894216_04930 [Synergistales bacterium]|nr:hypothetical protein FACS1894216_04930 [Synergistales bacterium]